MKVLTGIVPPMVNCIERLEEVALVATYRTHFNETNLRGIDVSVEAVQPSVHEVAPLNKKK